MNSNHILFADMVNGAKSPPRPPSVISSMTKVIALMSHAGSMDCFTSLTAPDGTPWKKLSRPRPDGSDVPLQDTGRLKQSVKASYNLGNIILQASHPGAAVHQFGATIKPRHAKYLTIPLTVEAKHFGSPGKARRQGPAPKSKKPKAGFFKRLIKRLLKLAKKKRKKTHGGPKGPGSKRKTHSFRGAEALRIYRAKSGKLFLVNTVGKKTIFHYYLTKEVTIPARPYLGWSAKTLAKIDRFIADTVQNELVLPLLGIKA